MKATELRIGNYYQYAGDYGITYAKVQEIKHNQFGLLSDFDGTNFEICKPIPLTEEWLLKFGFEKHGEFGEYYRIFNKGLIIDIEDTNNEFIVWVRIGDDILKPLLEVGYPIAYIQYVHQLQNLFYCLCGEELEIK